MTRQFYTKSFLLISRLFGEIKMFPNKNLHAFFVVAIIVSCQYSTAQQFYFPQKAYADSAEMNTSMPKLAAQLIEFLAKSSHSESRDYYETLLKYQLAAARFSDALNSYKTLSQTIAEEDSVLSQTIHFLYFAYAGISFNQQRTGEPFDSVITKGLRRQNKLYNAERWLDIEKQFSVDLAIEQKKFTDKKNQLKNLRSDSLRYEDARSLCIAYIDYIVHFSLVPTALSVFEKLRSENEIFSFRDSVLIPTRDGAILSARIAMKKNPSSPLPVVLQFSIYPRLDESAMQRWAQNDYVGIIAYTRGKYLSPQEVEPFEHDAADAYDLIDWISKQPWCNGKIGMVGGSYNGFTQWAAVKQIHPALKTIIPMVAVGPGIDAPYRNGVFYSYSLRMIHMITNAQKNSTLKFGDQEKWDSVFSSWYKSGRSYKSLDTIAGIPNKIFQRWLRHSPYDQFYRRMIPYKEEFEKINIPVLTITGYFDGDQLGALHYFNEHYKYNKNAEHYLVIGPYNHEGAQSKQLSPVQGYHLDPAALISVDELKLQWFNYILKDSSKPSLLKRKINFQVMGTNEWRHVSQLNDMNNDTLTFYLRNNREADHFHLSLNPGGKTEYINQQIDFTKRDIVGIDDVVIQGSALNKHGYLSFISEPVQQTFTLNGRFYAVLHTIINKKDMDIEMELYELSPDGKYFLLSWYLGRSSYAKDREKRQLLQPGKEEVIPIRQTDFTSKQISKGSRLILLLGIKKGKEYQVNYGTGKDVSDETISDGKIPLEVKWLSDSWIKIPVFK